MKIKYFSFLTFLTFIIILISFTKILPQENQLKKNDINEFSKMNFLLGEWKFNAKYLRQDGSFGSAVYRSNVDYTLGRKATADYFCLINPDGSLDTNGVTVRTYDERTKKWRMIFYTNDLNFYTIFSGDHVDGTFVFEGKGNEYGREFMEKVTFYNITDSSYSWKMNRSYDNGKTWIKNVFSYEAERIKE